MRITIFLLLLTGLAGLQAVATSVDIDSKLEGVSVTDHTNRRTALLPVC